MNPPGHTGSLIRSFLRYITVDVQINILRVIAGIICIIEGTGRRCSWSSKGIGELSERGKLKIFELLCVIKVERYVVK